MKKIIVLIICLFAVTIAGWTMFFLYRQRTIISPVGEKKITLFEKPLEKYSFERLKQVTFEPSVIQLGKNLKDEKTFQSFLFSYIVDDAYGKQTEKKVSGVINIPTTPGTYPLIVMLRGFVPEETYTPGEGTRRSGEKFAENGFITIAPDFLGYGESDVGTDDGLENRFQTYTTALTLLASLPNVSLTLAATNSGLIKPDMTKIGMWGHSNGGHIALASLAISGKPYPTVLWNPVSKPFPFSVLFFSDESEDNGKSLRKLIADFEKDYDAESFSPPNYYSWIQAPIQLHQGEDDVAVPLHWSEQLAENLKKQEKDITYFSYPGDDHNFTKGSWSTAVNRSIAFWNKSFLSQRKSDIIQQ